MSRRIWTDGQQTELFRAILETTFEDGAEVQGSIFGPYLTVGQAKSELTRQRRSRARFYDPPGLKVVDSYVEKSIATWERIPEMSKEEADRERQPDKDRVSNERKKDADRAEKERPT